MAANPIGQSFIHGITYLREFGPKRFVQEMHYRIVNTYHERRLAIETAGMVRMPDIGIDNADSVEYTPIGYSAIYYVLKRIPVPLSESVFLDLGSGKGRVVAVAATFPFKRVLGVEHSDVLSKVAEKNLQWLHHRKAQVVKVIHTDAAKFAIPDDVNVIYMFNPFTGETLDKVVRNILASHAARSRPMYVIFFNTIHFDEIISREGITTVQLIHRAHFYPNYSCGIYEIDTGSRSKAVPPDK